MAMIEWGQKSTPPPKKKSLGLLTNPLFSPTPEKKTPWTKMPNSRALKISRKHKMITRKINISEFEYS